MPPRTGREALQATHPSTRTGSKAAQQSFIRAVDGGPHTLARGSGEKADLAAAAATRPGNLARESPFRWSLPTLPRRATTAGREQRQPNSRSSEEEEEEEMERQLQEMDQAEHEEKDERARMFDDDDTDDDGDADD